MTPVQHSDAVLAQLSGDFDALLAGTPLSELHGKRLFITGGTGFIGLWLLVALRWLNLHGADIDVTLLARHPERFLARYPTFADCRWVHWCTGDIKDYIWPETPFDAIVHAAADTSPQAAATNALFDDIACGTQRVVDHAVARRIQRVLLLSSGAVYGEQPAHVASMSEDFAGLAQPLPANDAYGRGKRRMEAIAMAAYRQHGIEAVIARCFTFSGFGLPGHLAISQFVHDALFRGHLRLTGDGTALRSYQHAADLAVWLLALLGRGQSGLAYNVGSPHGLPLLDVANRIRDLLAPGGEIELLGQGASAPRQRYIPDTRRAEKLLGVNCRTSLEEAIRRMAEAIRVDRQTRPSG